MDEIKMQDMEATNMTLTMRVRFNLQLNDSIVKHFNDIVRDYGYSVESGSWDNQREIRITYEGEVTDSQLIYKEMEQIAEEVIDHIIDTENAVKKIKALHKSRWEEIKANIKRRKG